MTPRIPRGWKRTTYRCKDLWRDRMGQWIKTSSTGVIDPDVTYIRRTDPTVSTDPNHALRLEDEAARAPDAEPMVPGMMLVHDLGTCPVRVPLASLTWQESNAGATEVWTPSEGYGDDATGSDWIVDPRTPAEFAAAYTAAWEYTERRRAEIAEEVRRAGEPPAPDLGEWPGRPDMPPEHRRDVEILTPHGACVGGHMGSCLWWRVIVAPSSYAAITPRDVLAWRELPLAIVEDGRVTGVTRG